MAENPVKPRTCNCQGLTQFMMPIFILTTFLIFSKPGAVCGGFNYLNP